VIALDLAFSSAVRMIHRIMATPRTWLDAAPPRASGLAERFILMIKIANLANRGHAIDGKLAHFAAGHLHQREIAFFAEQLRRAACERTAWPPRPGYNSRLCTIVPGGMWRIISALPGRMSAASPVCTVAPTSRPTGCRM